MSDIYLCIGTLSKTPYFLSGLGVNIYSMDELCYYLVQNAFVLDNDIIDIKLCDFMRDDLKMEELSNKVRKLLHDKEALGEIVTTILSDTGYLSDDEIHHVRQLLVDNASLSFEAKRKSRADNLLAAGKYSRAIEEYQYVLNTLDTDEENELYADILHNVGCAYAKQFLFEKAANYYYKAYKISEDPESFKQYLVAKRLFSKKEDFERMVLREGYDEAKVDEIITNMNEVREEAADTEYSRKYDEVCNAKNEGRITEYYEMMDSLLGDFKNDYRRSMDVG